MASIGIPEVITGSILVGAAAFVAGPEIAENAPFVSSENVANINYIDAELPAADELEDPSATIIVVDDYRSVAGSVDYVVEHEGTFPAILNEKDNTLGTGNGEPAEQVTIGDTNDNKITVTTANGDEQAVSVEASVFVERVHNARANFIQELRWKVGAYAAGATLGILGVAAVFGRDKKTDA